MRINFESDLQKAKKGEEIVSNYLKGNQWTVNDISNDRNMFFSGIDFVVKKNEVSVSLDVKYDGMLEKTGNFCLENVNYTNGKKGWLKYSQADYIFVVSRQTSDIYVYSLTDMRQFIQDNYCRKTIVKDQTTTGVNEWECILVPIKDFSRDYPLQVITSKNIN